MKDQITQIFRESIEAKRDFLEKNCSGLVAAVQVIIEAFRTGGKVLLFGNGGSAADAQHLAAEFVNRYKLDRPALPAIALTTDSSTITSIANDVNFDEVFVKQIRALGKTGDIAIAISPSGNSVNVLRAVECSRQMGLRTIGLTGGDGGELGSLVDHSLCVSATNNTGRIQEAHILIGHAMCEMVEETLYGCARE